MANRQILAIFGFSVTYFAAFSVGCAPEKDTHTQINRGSAAGGAVAAGGASTGGAAGPQLRTAGASSVKSKVSVTSTQMVQADMDSMFTQIIDPSTSDSQTIADLDAGSYTTVETAIRFASKEDKSVLYMTINSGQLGAQFNFVNNKKSFVVDKMHTLTGLTISADKKSVQSTELGLQLNVKADDQGTNTTDISGPLALKNKNVFAQLLSLANFNNSEKIYKLNLKDEKVLVTARLKKDGTDLRLLVDFTDVKNEVLVMAIRLQKTDKPATPILNLSAVQTTSL